MYGSESWTIKKAEWSHQSILKETSSEYSLEGLMLKLKLQYFGHWLIHMSSSHVKNWERLRAGGEGGDRGWDGWMASPTQWTWVWANSGSWWWRGRPGVLWSVGSQRVRHDRATELNWTEAYKQIPENSVGYRFVAKRKVGRGRRPPLPFLSRCHACIISSSSRLGKGVFLSLHGQAKLTTHCPWCVQRARPRDRSLTELSGQGVGLMPPLFHCLGQRWYFCFLVLLLSKPDGFVVKPTCFQESPLTYRGLPYIFLHTIPKWISYLITYFDLSLCPYYLPLQVLTLLHLKGGWGDRLSLAASCCDGT